MMWFLLVVLVAAVVVIGIVVMEKRRTEELRRRFGPEYERAVEQHGARRAAESDLRRRLERRRSAEVRDLSPKVRERLCARWRVVQTGFVDDPQASVAEAARLVEQAMAERGYLGDGGGERGHLGDRSEVPGGGDRSVVRRDSDDDGRVAAIDDDRAGAIDDGDRVPGRDRSLDDGALGRDRSPDGDRADRSDSDRYELVAVDHPVLVERFRSAPRVGTGAEGVGDAPALSADDLRVLFLQHNELFEALVGGSGTLRSTHSEEVRS